MTSVCNFYRLRYSGRWPFRKKVRSTAEGHIWADAGFWPPPTASGTTNHHVLCSIRTELPLITVMHLCVSRPKPKSFRIKFSLWKKYRKQSTTDSIAVKNIIIHQDYNPQTYANDIALVQLEELNLLDKCMVDNPAVRAVCVPWSTQQFQPNDTCTISGWGRDKGSALHVK